MKASVKCITAGFTPGAREAAYRVVSGCACAGSLIVPDHDWPRRPTPDNPRRRLIETRFPHRVRELEHVLIPLADGTRLAARIWLPEDAERNPVPAILEYLPYRKRDGT